MTADRPEDIIRRALESGEHFVGADVVASALAALDVLLAERQQDKERYKKALELLSLDPVAVAEGLRKMLPELKVEDDEQMTAILDWIGVAGGDLTLPERVRILALELATKQGYSLAEAERLAPPALAAVPQDREGLLLEAQPRRVRAENLAAIDGPSAPPGAAVHEPAPRKMLPLHLRKAPAARVPAPPPARACLAVNPARFGERCVLPGGHVEPCEFPAPPPAPDICANPYRQDKQHSWRFDGDDPYIWCGACGTRRDALTGRNLPAPPQETADE